MKGYIFDLFGTLVTDDKWKPWDILLEEVLGEIDLKLRKEIMNKKDYGSDKICLETLKTKNNSNWSNKKDQKILQTFKRWRDAQIFYPATKKR